ncbi:hypothetical protein N0V83_006457 [Neocucurbitaria cava]|uniref:Uncharacterized protein n=1 Tax=Neocucurbitaria cava TaxID=798079 RepID=A0A9W9CL55_9PLEO|nr:hypothetical protein N0V83_006457 [Neocucurbitaria cava]
MANTSGGPVSSSTRVNDALAASSKSSSERDGTLPPGIEPHQIIDQENPLNLVDSEDERLMLRSIQPAPTSSAHTSSYALRNRGEEKSKLVYDLKYHPMDDNIRPSHAARRRLAHGELLLLSDDSWGSFFEETDTEAVISREVDNGSEVDEARKKVAKSKKRNQTVSPSCKPTRRSSRKTSVVKTAYKMDMHPQDEYLEVSSAHDSEVELLSHKRRKLQRTSPVVEPELDVGVPTLAKANHHKHRSQILDLISSDYTNVDEYPMSFDEQHLRRGMETDTDEAIAVNTLSLLPSVATPQLYGVRRKEGLDVWNLPPGDRYFRHDRDSWAISPGQSFEIFEERLEEQLAAEATALSPLNYEHDDKENNIDCPDFGSTTDMSVMPASQYRPSSEERQLQH